MSLKNNRCKYAYFTSIFLYFWTSLFSRYSTDLVSVIYTVFMCICKQMTQMKVRRIFKCSFHFHPFYVHNCFDCMRICCVMLASCIEFGLSRFPFTLCWRNYAIFAHRVYYILKATRDPSSD